MSRRSGRRSGAGRGRIVLVRGARRVVLGGAPEGLRGQPEARPVGEDAVRRLELVEHRAVLGGVRHHRHVGVVLGRAADHAGTADVDVLDRLREGDAGSGDRLLEGIERDRHQVDRADAVPLQRGHVLGHVATGQEAAVHLGVQRLHAPVEHLREAGDLRDVHHRDPGLPQEPGGAAGGDDLRAEGRQAPRELHHPGLVVHADQRPSESRHHTPLVTPPMSTRRPRIWSRPSANRRTASG